jgi:hypothetical protein
MRELRKGDKVKVIGTRTSSDYIKCEGIITGIIRTTNPRDIHAAVTIKKGTSRYPTGAETYIYLSDMELLIKELNKQTRVI